MAVSREQSSRGIGLSSYLKFTLALDKTLGRSGYAADCIIINISNDLQSLILMICTGNGNVWSYTFIMQR